MKKFTMNNRRPRHIQQIVALGMRELRSAELIIQATRRRQRTLTNLTVPPPSAPVAT